MQLKNLKKKEVLCFISSSQNTGDQQPSLLRNGYQVQTLRRGEIPSCSSLWSTAGLLEQYKHQRYKDRGERVSSKTPMRKHNLTIEDKGTFLCPCFSPASILTPWQRLRDWGSLKVLSRVNKKADWILMCKPRGSPIALADSALTAPLSAHAQKESQGSVQAEGSITDLFFRLTPNNYTQ